MTGPKVVLYDYPTSICSQTARLALLEKGVPFERRNIDIMKKAEQFEPWYTALNPKSVVPTLAIGDEIVTDTVRIVYRIAPQHLCQTLPFDQQIFGLLPWCYAPT